VSAEAEVNGYHHCELQGVHARVRAQHVDTEKVFFLAEGDVLRRRYAADAAVEGYSVTDSAIVDKSFRRL